MTNSASEKRERRLRLTESETQTENTAYTRGRPCERRTGKSNGRRQNALADLDLSELSFDCSRGSNERRVPEQPTYSHALATAVRIRHRQP